jgi:hypothetical protein
MYVAFYLARKKKQRKNPHPTTTEEVAQSLLNWERKF